MDKAVNLLFSKQADFQTQARSLLLESPEDFLKSLGYCIHFEAFHCQVEGKQRWEFRGKKEYDKSIPASMEDWPFKRKY